MRTLVGLLAVLALFLGALLAGMRATDTWDAGLVGLTSVQPVRPALRASPWKTLRLPAHGFALSLPGGWQTVPAGPPGRRRLAALRTVHPWLAQVFADSLLRNRAVRFRAFDVRGSADASRDQFVTNVQIRRGRAAGTPAATWRRHLAGLRRRASLVGPIRRVRLATRAGRAITLRYGVRMKRPIGAPLLLAVTEASIVAGRTHYLVTYTTTRRQAAAYEPTFRRSVRSFGLVRRA